MRSYWDFKAARQHPARSLQWRAICIDVLLGAAAVFAASVAVYSVIFIILTAARVLASLMSR